MSGIPERPKRRIYHKRWFVESINIPAALAAAVPTGWLLYSCYYYPKPDLTRPEIVLAIIGVLGAILTVALSVLKMLQGRQQDLREADEDRFDGLHSVLEVIHSLIRHQKGFDVTAKDKFRVTLHRIIKGDGESSSDQLEQLFDYVGARDTHGKGRRTSINCGVSGRAAREGEPFAASRMSDDHEAYIRELITVWGYTEADARKLDPTRNSWMAVPIKHKEKDVTGVVYMDSDEKSFFDEEVQARIIHACAGLAVFIDGRYK